MFASTKALITLLPFLSLVSGINAINCDNGFETQEGGAVIYSGTCWGGTSQTIGSDNECVSLHGWLYRNVGSIALGRGGFGEQGTTCFLFSDQNCQDGLVGFGPGPQRSPGDLFEEDTSLPGSSIGGSTGSIRCWMMRY